MKNVAFLTYNTVWKNLSSGWHEFPNGHRLFVLQNTKGGGTLATGPIGVERRREEIEGLWRQLQRELSSLDHVVIYLGARGTERAIELAKELPASKVTFVSCDCGLAFKAGLVQEAGLQDAGRILCECGGHQTMAALAGLFIATGELGLVSADTTK
ncbi:MAG: hypothetical protein Greene041619_1067 [Candidatus Peregrinibacteria bacterium Greene0416_19]|nr:MAG: hypothetical protein Greene041619_1067 [Candidatus Peregrinibacteria bacterium Greene0416_19]